MSWKDLLKSGARRMARPVPAMVTDAPSTEDVRVSHDPRRAAEIRERLPRGADVIRN